MTFEQFWQENQEKIKEQMKALYVEQQPKKLWEPKGGYWAIDSNGEVCGSANSEKEKIFGVSRQTKELAEAAAIKMRKFNRLLAYVDETCGEYKFDAGGNNYYVYLQQGRWTSAIHNFAQHMGIVYMPENIAKALVDKLNSGEVVL